MRLPDFSRSGTSHRVRIALHLNGLAFESVPVLETEEGIFRQSAVIPEYLEERYPTPPLLSSDRVSRVRPRTAASWISTYPPRARS